METARIRQAGYPIRYAYKDFVDRFRHLGKSIPHSNKGKCKESSQIICAAVFVNHEDYQLGHTKLFLKHQDNEFLEHERGRILSKYILVLQKAIRGWIFKRRFHRLREAAIVLQKYWRSRGYRSRYLIIRNGYQRLQATIRSRVLVETFSKLRRNMATFGAVAKGYLIRNKSQFGKVYGIVKERRLNEQNLKNSGNKNYRQEAEVKMQKSLEELNCDYKSKLKEQEDESIEAKKYVEGLFDFLKDSSLPTTPTDIKESEAFMVR